MGNNMGVEAYNDFKTPSYLSKPQSQCGIWRCGIILYEIWVKDSGLKDLIEKAIKDSNSKIKHVKWVKKLKKHEKLPIINPKNYVIFVQNNEEGPFSTSVGCQIGSQIISLCYPYYPGNACILHEMMHAMGFEHEHQRIDRDDYVTIDEECKFDFNNVKRGIPIGKYDYLSVMHYGEGACGVRILDNYYKYKVDNVKYVNTYSKDDIVNINKAYYMESIRWVAILYVINIQLSKTKTIDEWAKKYGITWTIVSKASKANTVNQLYKVLIYNGISDEKLKGLIWSAMYDIVNDYHSLPYQS